MITVNATTTPAIEELIDLHSLDKTIMLDLKYTTTDNFLNQIICYDKTARLRPQVAQAIVKVQQELKPLGLGLKIWDAYRPLSAQAAMWNILPDPRYIANPSHGGRHTRGSAVDLTLIDLKTGQELKMPTGFDDFSKKAHRTKSYSDPIIKANMHLLDNVMHKYGFVGFESEWWHYDYQGWEDFSVLKDY